MIDKYATAGKQILSRSVRALALPVKKSKAMGLKVGNINKINASFTKEYSGSALYHTMLKTKLKICLYQKVQFYDAQVLFMIGSEHCYTWCVHWKLHRKLL